MKTIRTAGIVGAGTMGSALAQKFAQEGFTVILADRDTALVERGISNIVHTLHDAASKNIFTQAQVDQFRARLSGTTNLEDLAPCDLVVEAIYEDFGAKAELFRVLSRIVSPDTILATNTSSFSVTELSAQVEHPGRFIGLHYFYHAAKNRLVEIIPGKLTFPETVQVATKFAVLSGKDPILTKDVYGFAINRFFVPWLNEAVKVLDEGLAGIDEIDAICRKAFGIGMGPFALMNATGIPIALHAQRTLECFGPAYTVAPLLEKQVDKKEHWKTGDGDGPNVSPEKYQQVYERMMGLVFFVCSQILAEEVCSATDLNKGAKIGLKWKYGPVDLMRRAGEAAVKSMVKGFAQHHGATVPEVSASRWNQEFVSLRKSGGHALITFNRPEELNALNNEVMHQLEKCFTEADLDPSIHTIFITGSGKAFVAGADIKFFVANIKNHSLNNIVDFTSYGQSVFDRIDRSEKKVVVLLNGLTLGGGLELALCGDVILATDKAVMAFPETGIGIYPGLGGTQRTQSRIGKGLAKYMILTGKMLKAKDALEIGMIDGIITAEDLFDIPDGKKQFPLPQKRALPEKWKAYAELYAKNNFSAIISGAYTHNTIDPEEIGQLGKTMRHKAPVAMQIAEDLINAAKGPASELDMLTTIFSTEDALLGLSSIGKKVEFSGR
ncbi:MAG: 3-hydroxyacyl-CoA dehydrogenase/enoyl-CoA hydratase family protein [Bacteroidia bacterium]|nr:3-hydroxyacyl-CoA dehydrogenase/enoyl-CoA hydratase family protein [Bacteroidia bacterium]